MANPKWGTKRICQGCAAKFYDLQKSPIICPSCGSRFDPEALLKSRRPRAAAKPEPKVQKPKAAPVEEDAVESEDDDETSSIDDAEADAVVEEIGEDDDSVIEDTSDLGDDDDMSEVVVTKKDDET